MVVPKQTLTPTTMLQTKPKQAKEIIRETEDLDLSSQPLKHVVELTTPQKNAILEQTQQTDHPYGVDNRKDRTKVNRIMLKATQMGMSKLQPKL